MLKVVHREPDGLIFSEQKKHTNIFFIKEFLRKFLKIYSKIENFLTFLQNLHDLIFFLVNFP